MNMLQDHKGNSYIKRRPYLSSFGESLKKARKLKTICKLTDCYGKNGKSHVWCPDETIVNEIFLFYGPSNSIKMGYSGYNIDYSVVFTFIEQEYLAIPVFDMEELLKEIIRDKLPLNYSDTRVRVSGEFIISKGTIKVK